MSTIRSMMREEELYQQSYEKVEEVPYGEIIASLFNPLELDIQIENQIIRRMEHDVGKIEGYGIENKTYKKSYLFDADGNCIRVIYMGVE